MSIRYLASILGVSPLSLSPVCSSSVRTEAARNSAWRLGGTRARKGLTALTAATSWLWLVKVKEDSCTYSTVQYSTVQYSTVQYRLLHLAADRPHPRPRHQPPELGGWVRGVLVHWDVCLNILKINIVYR